MSSKIVHDAEEFLTKLAKVIVDIYSGEVTVILFGGRARGTSSDAGDFDVLVVLRNVQDPIEEAVKIRRALPKRRFPLDILVIEPKDLEKPIIRKMLEHYKLLYDGLKIANMLSNIDFSASKP
ncbi:MAG: nucleotidyltransferase domain-containing protein [Candidatus Njordarchaeales archaeon]